MIKFEKLNIINNKDMKEILDTWESSVRATHDFLSEEKIISIKPQVKEGAKYVSNFLCVRDKKGLIRPFIRPCIPIKAFIRPKSFYGNTWF